MKRELLNISLSYANPNAVIVMDALKNIPVGRRSTALLEWAARGITGKFVDDEIVVNEDVLSEQELDDLLDNL